jgi:hypothetical protein
VNERVDRRSRVNARTTRIVAVGLVAAGALVITIRLLSVLLPGSEVALRITSETAGIQPVAFVVPPHTSGRIDLVTRRAGRRRPVRYSVRVATYAVAPTATLRVLLLDHAGAPLASCTIPPRDYRDNGPVSCDLRSDAQVARVRLLARDARGELAIWGRPSDGRTAEGGYWSQVIDLPSFVDRVRYAASRLAATRPEAFAPATVVAGLVISFAAALAALALAPRVSTAPRRDGPRERSRAGTD